MSKKVICLLLALSLMLCGCVYRSAVTETEGLTVYRIDTSENGGALVRRNVLPTGEGGSFEIIAAALEDSSGAVPSRSPLPDGVDIEALTYEEGVLTVGLSPQFIQADRLDRLLAESAIVLSFCTMDEVCYVNLCCDGVTIRSGLSPEDYSEADGLCGEFERSLKLYLPDEGNSGLVPRTVTVSEDGSMSSVQRVMSTLLAQLEGMEKAEIESISVEDGHCRLDLSHQFFGAEPRDSFTGMLMIYSIVNSLCRVPGVELVSLSVDGYSVESFGGFRTHWPLSENTSIIIY